MGGKKGGGGERIGKREWREQKEGEGDKGGGRHKWENRWKGGWRDARGGTRRSPFPPFTVALHSVQIPWCLIGEEREGKGEDGNGREEGSGGGRIGKREKRGVEGTKGGRRGQGRGGGAKG